MAEIERLIPFIIYFETGIRGDGLSGEQLFARAALKGVASDPADRGGATMVGITIGTYREYRRRKGGANTETADLRRLTYAEWTDVLRSMFWNRWRADDIADQGVAEMLVDWVWTSGRYGITHPQRLLGVKADGIVGPKTIAAVNARDPDILLSELRQARIDYIDRICRSRPANRKFRNGWLRRINALQNA